MLTIPLDSNTSMAASLGRLIGHWGILEGELAALLQDLLGVDQFRARMVFDTFPALTQKIKLIQRLLYAFVEDDAARTRALGFCERALSLNDQRNKYVHAVWAAGSTADALTLIPKSLPSNPKKRFAEFVTVSVKDIQDDVKQISELSDEMQRFGFQKGPGLVIHSRPLN